MFKNEVNIFRIITIFSYIKWPIINASHSILEATLLFLMTTSTINTLVWLLPLRNLLYKTKFPPKPIKKNIPISTIMKSAGLAVQEPHLPEFSTKTKIWVSYMKGISLAAINSKDQKTMLGVYAIKLSWKVMIIRRGKRKREANMTIEMKVPI